MDGEGATVIAGFVIGERRAVEAHQITVQIRILTNEHGAAPASGLVAVKQGRGDGRLRVGRINGAAQRTGYVTSEYGTFSNGHLGKLRCIGIQIDGTAGGPGSLASFGVVPIVFKGDIFADVQVSRSPGGDGAASAAVIAVCALGDRLVQIVVGELNIVTDGDRTAVAVDGTATVVLSSRCVLVENGAAFNRDCSLCVVDGTTLSSTVA